MPPKRKPIRVLHLVEYLYQGGIERVLQQLALKAPQDVEYIFYSYETEELRGLGLSIQEGGHPVLFSKKQGPGYNIPLLRKLAALVKERDVDIVHTHDFGPMEYALGLKLLRPSLKLIHTQHTLVHFLSQKKYIFFFQAASYFYHRIIHVSRHVEKSIWERAPWSKKNSEVIYNGVAVPPPLVGKEATPVGSLRLIGISRISREKNLPYLLQALKILKDQGIPFTYHHGGQGRPEYEKNLHQLVDELGLRNEVTFRGFISQVREFLEEGDIFLSSSTTEGHPVAVLEAMASSKICLCSRIPPHEELDSPGLDFFSLERGPEALAEKLSSYYREGWKDGIKMAMAARKTVHERFSLKLMVQNYTDLYRSFCLPAQEFKHA